MPELVLLFSFCHTGDKSSCQEPHWFHGFRPRSGQTAASTASRWRGHTVHSPVAGCMHHCQLLSHSILLWSTGHQQEHVPALFYLFHTFQRVGMREGSRKISKSALGGANSPFFCLGINLVVRFKNSELTQGKRKAHRREMSCFI